MSDYVSMESALNSQILIHYFWLFTLTQKMSDRLNEKGNIVFNGISVLYKYLFTKVSI